MLKPVSVGNEDGFYTLFQLKDSSLDNYSKGWVNFYRIDHYAVTTYFYLDKPSMIYQLWPGWKKELKM